MRRGISQLITHGTAMAEVLSVRAPSSARFHGERPFISEPYGELGW